MPFILMGGSQDGLHIVLDVCQYPELKLEHRYGEAGGDVILEVYGLDILTNFGTFQGYRRAIQLPI